MLKIDFPLGEVQVRRVYPDIFDACSATCERENLNSIINLNFMIFSRQNLILNSNFAAHRWRCKHQKYLDTLFLLELRLTPNSIFTTTGKTALHLSKSRAIVCAFKKCSLYIFLSPPPTVHAGGRSNRFSIYLKAAVSCRESATDDIFGKLSNR